MLDNAIKYCPEDGCITFKVALLKRMINITVSNTVSVPIPQESLPHLFDRFYRTDASRNSETGGHGIGLSIAQAITTAHGGNISATMGGEDIFKISVTLPA